jgi:hypothetical protein
METHLEASTNAYLEQRATSGDYQGTRRSRVMQISASAGQRGSLEAAPTTAACDGVYSSRLGCSCWRPPSSMDSSDHDDHRSTLM